MTHLDVVKWWESKNITSAEDLKKVVKDFQIVFACNNTNIEGKDLPLETARDIFINNKVVDFTGNVTDIIEVVNQRFAFNWIAKALERKQPITLEFIKKLHKILLNNCFNEELWEKGEKPGTFKVNDYCTGIKEVGTPPEYVEEDLQCLLDELNENTGGDILTKAAYFHACFERIHPFADGNGRVGRALANYYLILNNYPPLVLYAYDKETYFLALELFGLTDDLSGFLMFLREQLVKTWKDRILSETNNV